MNSYSGLITQFEIVNPYFYIHTYSNMGEWVYMQALYSFRYLLVFT